MRHYFQDKSVRLSKRERTQSILIDGAIEAVARHGIEGASIKEMTALAGVANGTFYNYFKTRDEILRHAAGAIATELADNIAKNVEEIPSGLGRVVVSTLSFIDQLTAAPEWGALFVEVVRQLTDVRDFVADHLKQDVALAIEQGDLAEMPGPFTLHQIASLIALGIEAGIKGSAESWGGADAPRQSCVAVLQLLGLPLDDARAAVQQHS